MYSLYIDTHLNNIVIILFKDGKIVCKLEKESSMSHSIYVLPMIEKILKNCNILKEELQEIYVVNGPGSFTGVRIGVTIAKTLAFCLNINIKSITSLEVKAVNEIGEKLVVVNEKNGKYIGHFDEDNNLISDYEYLSNKDFEEKIKTNKIKVVNELDIDYEKVYKFIQKLDYINAHNINPLYIKNLEV